MDKKNGLFIDEDKVFKILTEGVTQTDLKETKHELLTQIKQVKQTLDEVSNPNNYGIRARIIRIHRLTLMGALSGLAVFGIEVVRFLGWG